MARQKSTSTSPWVWIGCGCVLFAFLVAAGIFGGGYFIFDKGREMVETMADPQARGAQAAEILGAESLPEGYHARVALRIPFLFEMVLLSDGPLDEEPPPADADLDTKAQSLENMLVLEDDVGEHLFIALKMRGRSNENIEDVLSGDDRVQGAQADLGMRFTPDEDLGSGTLTHGEATIAWHARRGVLELRRSGEIPGVWAVLDVTCSDGSRPMALWFETTAAPADGQVVGEITMEATGDLAGPADPDMIDAFLGHFDLCA
ncbi:MAG: hypothetical protein AAGC60_12580 [Acidobacteriota bacterium]